MPKKIDYGKVFRESLFYWIARHQAEIAKKENDEWKRKQAVTISIMCCAICLEAFINPQHRDFETSKLLSFDDKWLNARLKLGASQIFKKNTRPWTIFRELIKLRDVDSRLQVSQ